MTRTERAADRAARFVTRARPVAASFSRPALNGDAAGDVRAIAVAEIGAHGVADGIELAGECLERVGLECNRSRSHGPRALGGGKRHQDDRRRNTQKYQPSPVAESWAAR